VWDAMAEGRNLKVEHETAGDATVAYRLSFDLVLGRDKQHAMSRESRSVASTTYQRWTAARGHGIHAAHAEFLFLYGLRSDPEPRGRKCRNIVQLLALAAYSAGDFCPLLRRSHTPLLDSKFRRCSILTRGRQKAVATSLLGSKLTSTALAPNTPRMPSSLAALSFSRSPPPTRASLTGCPRSVAA
jgi:hypothetical protein